jgi:hypothetical protein
LKDDRQQFTKNLLEKKFHVIYIKFRVFRQSELFPREINFLGYLIKTLAGHV